MHAYALLIDQAVLEARRELEGKVLRRVQIDTAIKWTGRAIAAMTLRRPADAHEYAHEALEHAALSGDDMLLREVKAALSRQGVEF
jgi:hypothetical protein